MRKFKYKVAITVEVEAFDEVDAREAVMDAFGIGDVCGLEVTESEVGILA